MKLLKQENHQCLITSVAMLIDESLENLLRELDHEPTNHIHLKQNGNDRMRGTHMQEIITQILWPRNLGLTQIGTHYRLGPSEQTYIERNLKPSELLWYIKYYKALLTTDNHCVAWDGHQVYDPQGHIYEFSSLITNIQNAWILSSLTVS